MIPIPKETTIFVEKTWMVNLKKSKRTITIKSNRKDRLKPVNCLPSSPQFVIKINIEIKAADTNVNIMGLL